MAVYEVTFLDNGVTRKQTEAYWRKHFGAAEWQEIKAGYLPNIVAMEVS